MSRADPNERQGEEEEEEGDEEEPVTYRLYGSNNSPYSVKVRAYLRFKRLRHEWIVRDFNVQEEFNALAKLPIVPLVVDPTGAVMQDSTPIIEAVEAAHPEPSIRPADSPALNFVAELLEEFSDEWANKWMFHFRWARPADQVAVSERLAAELLGAEGAEDVAGFAATVRGRMTKRGFAVGSNPTTAPFLERTFQQAVVQLDAHLHGREYLLGSRPCIADFGLASQLYQCLIDPTPGRFLREHAPSVRTWCLRVLSGATDGYTEANAPAAFETWASLGPTLEPFLRCHVRIFLTWSAANAAAIAQKAKELTVKLKEEHLNGVVSEFQWTSTIGSPQRYHAKSLGVLLRKFAAARADAGLRGILSRCGCLDVLDGAAAAVAAPAGGAKPVAKL